MSNDLPRGRNGLALSKINEIIAFYTANPGLWIAGNKVGKKRCARDLLIDLGAEEFLTAPILDAAHGLGHAGHTEITGLNDEVGFEVMMKIFEQARLDLGGAPKPLHALLRLVPEVSAPTPGEHPATARVFTAVPLETALAPLLPVP